MYLKALLQTIYMFGNPHLLGLLYSRCYSANKRICSAMKPFVLLITIDVPFAFLIIMLYGDTANLFRRNFCTTSPRMPLLAIGRLVQGPFKGQ